MDLTESTRFVATEADKALLAAIARQDGNSSMSAVIRRLIRQEAQWRGIVSLETETISEQVPE